MPKVVFDSFLKQYTAGIGEVFIAAGDYRAAVEELLTRFPELPRDIVERYRVAIDGVIVHRPFLESLGERSELRFISLIGGG